MISTMCHLDMNRQDESVQPPFKHETSNDLHSYNIQATSKGSGQTVRMSRLI